jgi:hypothetical protein
MGWFIGCTSNATTTAKFDKLVFVVGDKPQIVDDSSKVNIQDYIKDIAAAAKNPALAFCSKECKADGDCGTHKGVTSKCSTVAGKSMCVAQKACPSGVVLNNEMCVVLNPFSNKKGTMMYKTYMPVPNHDHKGFHASIWNLENAAESYLPLHLSNWIGGILMGHMLQSEWKWPIEKLKKQYLYGTLFSQLFQESEPDADPKVVAGGMANGDPSLLGVGQGGPWQLNDYSKPLDTAGLVNYIAIQHSLNFTVADQTSGVQNKKFGPKTLSTVDVGAIYAAYFHFNDVKRYQEMMDAPFRKGKPEVEEWAKCKANIESGQFDTPDQMLNVWYNAGPFASIAKLVVKICANNDKEAMKSLTDYSLSDDQFIEKFQNKYPKDLPKKGTTYILYLRQINYYIDQFLNDNEELFKRKGMFADTDVKFTLGDVQKQFLKSLPHLGFVDGKTKNYSLFTQDMLTSTQPKADLTKGMSFTQSADRDEFYKFVIDWFTALETKGGFKFGDLTVCQQEPGKDFIPTCDAPGPHTNGTAPHCAADTPEGWCSLTNAFASCNCQKDADGKLQMTCKGKYADKCKEEYKCQCSDFTGTTTAAPPGQKGDPCSAQTCADGLGCLYQLPVGNGKSWAEVRDQEKGTCEEMTQDPMVEKVIQDKARRLRMLGEDSATCAEQKDCKTKGSVCVIGVYYGPTKRDAECRSFDGGNCSCKPAASSTSALIKKYIAEKK